jgi:DNA repair ATPase RecN
MKKIILLAIIAVLILTLMASCSSGISQEQYKKATDDLAAAQAQVQSLQTQTQTLQVQVQSLQSQIQTSQNDHAALADLQNKINQTKSYWDLFAGFYQIGITGQTPNAAQIMDMMSKMQAMGDTALTGKMQGIISSNGGTKESMDFVNYLISKIGDSLK